jgi:hypothetical protein
MGAGTGRNEPCPCGSGRKYKKCCLEKDEKAARVNASPAARVSSLFARLPPEIAEEGVAAIELDEEGTAAAFDVLEGLLQPEAPLGHLRFDPDRFAEALTALGEEPPPDEDEALQKLFRAQIDPLADEAQTDIILGELERALVEDGLEQAERQAALVALVTTHMVLGQRPRQPRNAPFLELLFRVQLDELMADADVDFVALAEELDARRRIFDESEPSEALMAAYDAVEANVQTGDVPPLLTGDEYAWFLAATTAAMVAEDLGEADLEPRLRASIDAAGRALDPALRQRIRGRLVEDAADPELSDEERQDVAGLLALFDHDAASLVATVGVRDVGVWIRSNDELALFSALADDDAEPTVEVFDAYRAWLVEHDEDPRWLDGARELFFGAE